MIKEDLRNLKKRYLVWFYKSTKEALDKIERKFTQVEIDKFILKELKKKGSKDVKSFIDDFEVYIQKKEQEGLNLKYIGKELRPEYQFLFLKLEAIEKSIIKELGKETLKQIKSSYEREMTERILKSTEH